MEAFWTIVLAGIGAFIANFGAKYVETLFQRSKNSEDQRNSDLQDLIAAARSLGEMSERFWVKGASDLGMEGQVLRSQMIAQQHNIAELVETLFTSPIKWDCDVKVHALIEHATGGDFWEPDREADPGRLTAILVAVHGLVHAAKAGRRKMRHNWLA
ncbi:hypothetical protein [Shinella zoogloeoides]|uniref:hypothetical protein n=1 Tax=Shinella zoogloeoides TaxID=352475 RepID=UPI0013C34CBF|nr:hypothetical protein [Shinella zoogloeoides]